MTDIAETSKKRARGLKTSLQIYMDDMHELRLREIMQIWGKNQSQTVCRMIDETCHRLKGKRLAFHLDKKMRVLVDRIARRQSGIPPDLT